MLSRSSVKMARLIIEVAGTEKQDGACLSMASLALTEKEVQFLDMYSEMSKRL